MTNKQPGVEGYFDACDQLAYESLARMYCVFIRDWVFSEVQNWKEMDKFVFHFEHEQLHKVDAIVDRKITKSYSRDEWLFPVPDLDSKSSEYPKSIHAEEYLANEAKFMKYVRFCHWVVPTSDSSFVIPVTTKEPNV